MKTAPRELWGPLSLGGGQVEGYVGEMGPASDERQRIEINYKYVTPPAASHNARGSQPRWGGGECDTTQNLNSSFPDRRAAKRLLKTLYSQISPPVLCFIFFWCCFESPGIETNVIFASHGKVGECSRAANQNPFFREEMKT